jgi:DNA adenine methylase
MTRVDAKPILKWAGGKQALAARLIAHFPRRFARYYEPFVGGGSVLLALKPKRAVVGDQNDWLLDTYDAIRTDPARIAAILDAMPNSREDYARLRAIRPESLDLHHRAALLIYLNKTCFRGLFRVNRHGHFNVPYGAYDRRYYDPQNLDAVARCLKTVEIRRADFTECVVDATRQDFVYMDPPYHRLGGYSDFNRYTKFQFREDDHVRLADFCRQLDRRGVRWAVSNSDTSLIRALFDGYSTVVVANRREINLNARDRDISELLIRNYE